MTDATLSALPIAVSDELESPARRALRRLFKRKGAVAGLVVIATFVLLAVFAPLISPYEPIVTSWSLVRKPPSALHWFGTDELGRDILARVIYGARASLLAGAISVGIALSIGVPLGLLSGYRGGFLGLGQQPPAPSWGSMLNAAQRFLTNAPWMAVWPGLAIFLVVLSFNLVGDGLRDALDPRER